MKVHYKIIIYFFFLTFLAGFTSCNLFDGKKEYKTYTIPGGGQSSHSIPSGFKRDELRFLAKFDNTAMYANKDPLNQLDLNKLYGFSDCGDAHHTNSARFGWRWLNNKLEIFAYCYNNGLRESQYINTIQLNQEYEYKIYITGNKYVFSLNGASVVMNRGCSDGGKKYYLFPFFGGDETAPHDITIRIKELN